MLHAPELVALPDLDRARNAPTSGARLRSVCAAARELRVELLASAPVVSVRTLPLATLAYPTRFAFWSAALSPAPYISMVHRALLVQFRQRGALKSLLFNPSDVVGARRTPFFARLVETYGRASELLSHTFPSLESQLAELGLAPDAIDYVAFDHFHTQDLRSLLGTLDGRAPRFPNARLLAPRDEWMDWGELHPLQRAWYVADGRDRVREDRVVFTTESLMLGDGVALVRTPGHTSGNQTLFVRTDTGVWGVSENGVCVDNWSPEASRIAGVARTARLHSLDVVPNSNTPESGEAQYTSMMLEKAVVDRAAKNSAFVQMLSSSEATRALFAPGLAPTMEHRAITHGSVVNAPRTTSSPPHEHASDAPA